MGALLVVTLRPRDASRGAFDAQAYPGRPPSTSVYLHPRDQGRGAHDVQLRPWRREALPAPAAGPAFPTQYQGLRIWHSGAVVELCLVATADAPAGMGGQPRIRKGGTTYALYLVETSDPNASPVRLRTSAGTKSIRRYTT